MRFNEAVRELSELLRICWQDKDGNIYWHEGTLELLAEVVKYCPGVLCEV